MRSSFLQHAQVMVVEASAGSGKTYALARRYVQLALAMAQDQSLPIQSILAITFTNKATLAMKSRILDFLKRIALKQLTAVEFENLVSPIGLDEDEAARLASVVMGDVIRQYHYFQVQTIDSFINTLLAGCSFKVGLSARFKIQRNSADYLQLALDELLQAAGSDKKIYQLFEDFTRQYLYLENRSGWFLKDDLLKVMSTLFNRYNTYQKPFVPHVFKEDLFKKKHKIYGMIEELNQQFPPQTPKVFIKHVQGFLSEHAGGFDVDDLSSVSWSREEFPVNKGGEVSSQLQEHWDRLRVEIQELCWIESQSMFNQYIAVFEALLSDFYQLSKRDDVLFLEELNRKAASLFDDGLVSIQELYFRLATRFKHYLIDEFQDTSLAQWRNLSLMVEEALASQGSLFYVGDKKQAIYSFRGGESRLFDALQRQLAVPVNMQSLDHNYRSCPQVIEFNNKVFSVENLCDFLDRRLEDAKERKRDGELVQFNEEDLGALAITFSHSHQLPGKGLTGGVVRAAYLSGRTSGERNIEARERLMALIAELTQRFKLQDIAILTRGNDQVQEITQWLLHEGIQAQSERSSDIKHNTLIQELIALLTFLNSPIDNNAFAQFCLGELMPTATGLPAEELRAFLFDAARRAKQERDIYFYRLFRERYPLVWADFFEDAYRRVGVFPLYELMVGIIARFECERHFAHYQGFVMHLLQLIKTREEESCDLASFLQYFDKFEDQDRFVPSVQSQAVKVLTVHKAKGLEFPVVIVPFLEMDIKVGAGGRDGGLSYVLDIQEEGMSLVRLKEGYRRFSPSLQALYETEYKKALLMELNIAYVALTRAIEELYIFIPEKVGNSINQAKFLIPPEFFALGAPAERPLTHEALPTPHQLKTAVNDKWLASLREEFLNQETISAAAARQGEVYHALLMQVGNLAVGEVILPQEIEAIVNAGPLKQFFYLPREAVVYCEKEFVNAYGDTKRIDRLIVFPDVVWVIDYKSSQEGYERHRTQMQGYMELVKSFYPTQDVKGYLIYLDNLNVINVTV